MAIDYSTLAWKISRPFLPDLKDGASWPSEDEFLEEAGVATLPEDWTHFATVSTEYMYMPCYFLRSNDGAVTALS